MTLVLMKGMLGSVANNVSQKASRLTELEVKGMTSQSDLLLKDTVGTRVEISGCF